MATTWCCRLPTMASALPPGAIRARPAWASASSARWLQSSKLPSNATPPIPARAWGCALPASQHPRKLRRAGRRIRPAVRAVERDERGALQGRTVQDDDRYQPGPRSVVTSRRKWGPGQVHGIEQELRFKRLAKMCGLTKSVLLVLEYKKTGRHVSALK